MSATATKTKGKAPARAKAPASKPVEEPMDEQVPAGEANAKPGRKATVLPQEAITARIAEHQKAVTELLAEKAEVEAVVAEIKAVEKPTKAQQEKLAESVARLDEIRMTRKAQRRKRRNLHRASETPIEGCQMVCCRDRQPATA